MKIHLSGPAIILVVILAAILFYFYPILLVIAIILGVLYAIGYYGREKCPSCGARGTIVNAGTEEVTREKAYGLVTRTDTSTTRKRDSSGKVVKEEATTHRKERVPVVSITSRTTYRCSKCGHSHSKESVSQEEDFSRKEEPAKEKTVVLQKEIVKVPCKYCGTLNEVTERKCSNCGAVIR